VNFFSLYSNKLYIFAKQDANFGAHAACTEYCSKVGGNNAKQKKTRANPHESFYASLQPGRNEIPSCQSTREWSHWSL